MLPSSAILSADPACPVFNAYTGQLSQLKAGLVAAINAAFAAKMSGPSAPAEPVLPLRRNAGLYGPYGVGGVLRSAGGQLVAMYRGGGELSSLQKLDVEVLLNVLGQMERDEYFL